MSPGSLASACILRLALFARWLYFTLSYHSMMDKLSVWASSRMRLCLRASHLHVRYMFSKPRWIRVGWDFEIMGLDIMRLLFSFVRLRKDIVAISGAMERFNAIQ